MLTKIEVTKPFLPPISEYFYLLEKVWESGILTHNGPMVQSFENLFSQKYNLKNTLATSNGTIALQIAIRALKLKGEIITTPFTWVATASSIIWEHCTPVFVDIDCKTLNIDCNKIEKKITRNTCAILPVHVFGSPCDCSYLEEIARKFNIKVIYDAAHAVGSSYNGKSVLSYGDVTATSFHATKLLNTAEGGACFSDNSEIIERIKQIRFFGHNDNKEIVTDGFNGKMTEIHAALGIINLTYIDEILADRKKKYFLYKSLLEKTEMIQFQTINVNETNFSYFPIVLRNESVLDKIVFALNNENIYPRRYFYPAINTLSRILSYQEAPISEEISSRILCLPLYYDLDCDIIEKISNIILRELVS